MIHFTLIIPYWAKWAENLGIKVHVGEESPTQGQERNSRHELSTIRISLGKDPFLPPTDVHHEIKLCNYVTSMSTTVLVLQNKVS